MAWLGNRLPAAKGLFSRLRFDQSRGMTDASADTVVRSRVGQTVGKFRIDRQLGHGAMGDVFLAHHADLGHPVAVKVLNRRAADEPNGVQRFLNEAKAVAQVNHENIARVIDCDVLNDGTPYIVLEYVDGVVLRDLLSQRAPLPFEEAVALMLDVLAGLAAAHAKGIVHRDVKPENIRVMPNGRAKILDFGVAKWLSSPTPALTEQGALVGTPQYMAPEQIEDLPLDGRCDVYAVGVTLYECVTGRRPFEGATLLDLLRQQVDAAPPWPHALRPDVTPELETVILRALEKSPARRFESAAAMADALSDARRGGGPRAAPAPPERAAYLPTRREPRPPPPALESRVEAAATPNAHGRAVIGDLRTTGRFSKPAAGGAVALAAAGSAVGLWRVTPRAEREPLPSTTVVPSGVAPVGPDAVVAPAPVTPEPVAPAATPTGPVANREPNRKPLPTVSPEAKRPAAKGHDGVVVAAALAPPASTVTKRETGADRGVRPVDFDAHRFDALGFVGAATAEAKAHLPDAVLVGFAVDGVFADGHTDLSLSPEFRATYTFRSPSLSQANPAIPDDAQEIRCLFFVDVSAKTVEWRTAVDYFGCRAPALPPWGHCSLKDVWQLALAQGAPRERAAKVTWLRDGWQLQFGEAGDSISSLKCP